jgi:hypothetical protein
MSNMELYLKNPQTAVELDVQLVYKMGGIFLRDRHGGS